MFAQQGQYEKTAEITRRARLLSPDLVALYGDLANYTLALERFDETRQVIHEATQARRLDNLIMHNALYALAFLGPDAAAMAEQQQWYASKSDYDNFGLALASDTESSKQGTGADPAGSRLRHPGG